MSLQELKDDEIFQLLKEIKEAEELQYVSSPSKLRDYMNTLNPSIALIQTPIDIWKEAANRWSRHLNF